MHCHSNIKTLSGCWPSGLGLSWDICVTYWHADVPSPSPAPDSRIVPMQILGHSKLQAREGVSGHMRDLRVSSWLLLWPGPVMVVKGTGGVNKRRGTLSLSLKLK